MTARTADLIAYTVAGLISLLILAAVGLGVVAVATASVPMLCNAFACYVAVAVVGVVGMAWA